MENLFNWTVKLDIYEILIEPKSSFITEMQSDTLFGHYCWYLCYSKGEKELQQFLKDQTSDGGRFIFSSAFPEGMLPKPNLRPISIEDRQELKREEFKDSELGLTEKLKDFAKIKFVPENIIEGLINNLNERELFKSCLPIDELWPKPLNVKNQRLTIKASINRNTNSVLEGRLFSQEEKFYAPGSRLRLFFASDFIPDDEVQVFFEKYLVYTGFGKKKSTGKGSLEFISMKKYRLPCAENADAFITLSNYVPANSDPFVGTYEIFTKYPKVGGDFAYSSAGCWKKPLLMYKPGSIFYLEDELSESYGALIPNVYRPRPEVHQCGYALPLGVRLNASL